MEHLNRKRGRPFKRWVDKIMEGAGQTWARVATDSVIATVGSSFWQDTDRSMAAD